MASRHTTSSPVHEMPLHPINHLLILKKHDACYGFAETSAQDLFSLK